ncbi:putative HTH-type transcriptional repressor ExuR [Abditibacteriota bacterium]|nr:putative HTH-type transcriptional repressor ExuR [Abditibacteriota bacterium]
MPRRKDGSDLPKRVTLQDIAVIAGVHRMTVSDALNGTGSVAPTTREKVRQIARELNYIPNFAARALSRGRTGIIAILTGALNEPYYANMVHVLERHISEDGFHAMLMRTPDGVKDIISATGNVAVDGVVAVDMLGIVDEFWSHPTIPCVTIGTIERTFVDCVIADLSASVKEAVELMLSAGRQRVAYLATSTYMAQEVEVRAGTYAATMRSARRPPEIINLQSDIFNAGVIEARFKAHLTEFGCPDGLLCQNDEIAMCAFVALQSLGYKVPDDVLLVGCDGQQHMAYFKPPLSTIAQPIEQMSAVAWEFLKRRMTDPTLPRQQAKLPGKLLVRESLRAVASE